LEEKLKNSEELIALNGIYEKLEAEKGKNGIYKQIGRKYIHNENTSTNGSLKTQTVRPFIARTIDLILKLIQKITTILFLTIDRSIKTPFIIALNITKKVKTTFIDIPLNMTCKLSNIFLFNPARYLLNKLKIF
jgi:hypothetical protein